MTGLGTLSYSATLSHAAQAKAEDMVRQNYWSHVAPDGTTPWSYFQQSDYDYVSAGENLAYGFTTSEQVITAWMNSPEHRDNVLGTYSEVGFGFVNGEDYQNGKNTLEFLTILSDHRNKKAGLNNRLNYQYIVDFKGLPFLIFLAFLLRYSESFRLFSLLIV